MSIITIEIDLAKNIFAVHGVNETGKAELVKPRVTSKFKGAAPFDYHIYAANNIDADPFGYAQRSN